MTEHLHIPLGARLRPSFLQAIQEELSGDGSFDLTQQATNAMQIVASATGSGNGQASVAINGRYRRRTSTVVATVPGGTTAGTYPIYVAAHDAVISDTPTFDADSTDYSFTLALVTVPGGYALSRQIGTFAWDGTKITSYEQTAGLRSTAAIPRLPTAGQKDALVGPAGFPRTGSVAAPSSTNPYVTNDDARVTPRWRSRRHRTGRIPKGTTPGIYLLRADGGDVAAVGSGLSLLNLLGFREGEQTGASADVPQADVPTLPTEWMLRSSIEVGNTPPGVRVQGGITALTLGRGASGGPVFVQSTSGGVFVFDYNGPAANFSDDAFLAGSELFIDWWGFFVQVSIGTTASDIVVDLELFLR